MTKWLTLMCACVAFPSMAQICYSERLPSTTPSERFIINTDGTVEDIQTGLMWQSCNYGQSYNSETALCEGNSQQLTWQEALLGAAGSTLADYDDWQIPTVKELSSIVERQCVDPALNTQVFKGHVNQNYWTSTSSIDVPDHAWVYAFYSGKNSLQRKTSDVYLRLVRYVK